MLKETRSLIRNHPLWSCLFSMVFGASWAIGSVLLYTFAPPNLAMVTFFSFMFGLMVTATLIIPIGIFYTFRNLTSI